MVILKYYKMKIIQTEYGGSFFRSRLEARWAVFLDELGWSWEFEPEGFSFDGIPYLPDFYLLQLDTWIEVKGNKFTEEEVLKCKLLSLGKPDATVMMVSGRPCKVNYPCFCNGQLMEATLTKYIRTKGWSSPYFCGNWEKDDDFAFKAAAYARFEHGEKGYTKYI